MDLAKPLLLGVPNTNTNNAANLRRAAQRNDLQAVLHYLPNSTFGQKEQALTIAINNDWHLVAEQIYHRNPPWSVVGVHKPFYWAVRAGSHRTVKMFINMGLHIYDTYLLLACSYGHVSIAKQLLSANASISCLDYSNCTPLHKACAQSNRFVARLLVQHKARLDARSADNSTPVDSAQHAVTSRTTKLKGFRNWLCRAATRNWLCRAATHYAKKKEDERR